MRNKSMLPLATVVTGCCITLIACTTVTPPSSDPTPPVLTWHIENQTTGASSSVTGSGSVAASVNDSIRITLKADDPQGIQLIELGGGYVTSCQAGDAASSASGSFGTDSQPLSPDAQGNVLTSIFLIKTVVPDVSCPGGSSWQSTSVSLNGLGRNYFSGTTTGTLAITYGP